MSISLPPGDELVLDAKFDPRWKTYETVRSGAFLLMVWGPLLVVLSTSLFGYEFLFKDPGRDDLTNPDDFISRLSEILSSRVLFSVVAVASLVLIRVWWSGAYFKSLKCCLTTQSIVFHKGVLRKTEKTIPLTRVQDLDVYQGSLMRKFDIQGLRVETAGQNGARGVEANLVGLINARDFRDRVLNQCHSLESGTVETDTAIEFTAEYDERLKRWGTRTAWIVWGMIVPIFVPIFLPDVFDMPSRLTTLLTGGLVGLGIITFGVHWFYMPLPGGTDAEIAKQKWGRTLRPVCFLVFGVGIIAWSGSWYMERDRNATTANADSVAELEKNSDSAAALEKLGAYVFQNEQGVQLNAGITDALLVHLKRLTNLQQLNLGRLATNGTPITDAGLVHLKELTNLQSLSLADTQITDAGLVHLKGLTNLQTLSFYNTKITDAALVHLKELTNLQSLTLANTQISDAGLVHLKQLTNLQTLSFSRTQINDAGLVHLKGMTNLQSLFFGQQTQITDAGLVHLKGLTGLYKLKLTDTQITDEGLLHLKGLTNLQWLNLSGSQITDAGLVHLKGLTKLKGLTLFITKITDAGVADLKKALPNCKIEK